MYVGLLVYKKWFNKDIDLKIFILKMVFWLVLKWNFNDLFFIFKGVWVNVFIIIVYKVFYVYWNIYNIIMLLMEKWSIVML